jgi:hypothetical protein
MRGVWAGSLGLSLGVLVGGASAQEAPWRPVLGRPTAAPPAVAPAASPAVVLGRPVPLPAPPGLAASTAAQVTPVSFNSFSLIGAPRPIIRAQSADIPLPLPPGPAPSEPAKLPSEPGLATQNSDKPAAEAPTLTMPRKAESGDPDGSGTAILEPDIGSPPSAAVGPDLPGALMEFDPGCDCEMCCGRRSRLWVSGEYLLWWIKDSALPPLVTTSPAGTPRELAGVLGAPGTAVLLGGSSLDNQERSGGRVALGVWLDPAQRWALETNFFYLAQRTVHFNAGSGGTPILARPIFDVTAGQESSELVAFPNLLAGRIAVSATSRFWGLEENLRGTLFQSSGPYGTCYRVGLLGGFRYLRLDEGLGINESLQVAPGVPMSGGSSILVSDQFGTHNSFYGGQLGAMLEMRRGRWYGDLMGKVALGMTHQVVNINGSTSFAVPGGPTVVQPGGLLALPTNIGHYSRDLFGVVPEVGLKIGYQVTPHVRAFVGYSLLYWNDVARPGNQIDRVVNVSQLPMVLGTPAGAVPPRPAFAFHGTDFWAQGVSLGLEFRY